MAKSVTVTFDDGTNHTYDNVPDEVTDDQVTQRAGQDFGDKTITGVVGGSAPASAPEAGANANGPVAPELSMGQKALGAAATAANLAAEHPALAAGAAGLYKANKMANTWMAAKNAETSALNQRTAQQAATEAAKIEQSKARMAERMARGAAPAEAPPQRAPMGFVDTNAPRMGPVGAPAAAPTAMPQGMAQGINAMPGAGAGPAPAPAMPEGPPSSQNFMSRMTQLAERYLPAAKSAAGTAGRVIAPVARVLGSAPVMGAQLAMHSGGLNTNEEEELRRRQAMQPTFTFPQQ